MPTKVTTAQIIKEFKEEHGNKYDYSKVEYVLSTKDVIIICPKHGEFLQKPSKHKSGNGCPDCGNERQAQKKSLSIDKVITQFRKVHGNRYDYSKVKYKNTHSNVIIICPDHGEFFQTPSKHKSGRNCPYCSGNTKKTKEEIINEFVNRHGYKYDYSKVEYNGAHENVIIICRDHGEFTQTPSIHKRGGGCPDCSGNVLLTTVKFIERCKDIHGDTYDYSKVDYKNAHTDVILICSIHGEFSQSPEVHLRGSGCRVCGGTAPKTRKQVIEEFKTVHGNRYDYSKVIFKTTKDKVEIICSNHGIFKQSPENHRKGKGCPFCSLTPQSKQELTILFELKSIFPRIDPRGFKTRINQKVISLDIYIPELNLGIEFDGHHWHKDKTDFDSMKSKKIRGAGFNLFRIREEPLEKLSDEDIISKIPFNPKNIVRDILAQIEERLSISSKTQGLFNQYNRNKTLVNDKELDEYIEEVLRMNPDK